MICILYIHFIAFSPSGPAGVISSPQLRRECRAAGESGAEPARRRVEWGEGYRGVERREMINGDHRDDGPRWLAKLTEA